MLDDTSRRAQHESWSADPSEPHVRAATEHEPRTHIAAAPPTGTHRTHGMLSSLAWHTGTLATLLHI